MAIGLQTASEIHHIEIGRGGEVREYYEPTESTGRIAKRTAIAFFVAVVSAVGFQYAGSYNFSEREVIAIKGVYSLGVCTAMIEFRDGVIDMWHRCRGSQL